MSRSLPWMLLLLASCAAEDDADTSADTSAATGTGTPSTSDPTTGTGGTTVDGCGATPPELTANTVVDTAIGTGGPSVGFTFDMTDADGDLDVGHYMVWGDFVVDGAVDTTGTPALFDAIPPMGDPDPCTTSATMVIRWVTYEDLGLSYDTEVEFALQVDDAEGNVSELAIRTLCTLTEAGEPGGC